MGVRYDFYKETNEEIPATNSAQNFLGEQFCEPMEK